MLKVNAERNVDGGDWLLGEEYNSADPRDGPDGVNHEPVT